MNRNERWIFSGTALLLLLARLPLLSPGYASADDLVHRSPAMTDGVLWRLFAGQARPGQALLYLSLRWLGVQPIGASSLLALLAIALSALAAVWLARAWDIGERPWTAVLAAGIAFLHPYQMDHWEFRYMPLCAAAATALWTLSLCELLAGRRLRGALLIVLAASIYQTAVAQLVVAAILCAALAVARAQGAPAGSARAPRDSFFAAVRPAALAAMIAAGAAAAWLVAWRGAMKLLAIAPDARLSIVPLPSAGELFERVRYLAEVTLIDDRAFAAPLLTPLLVLLALLFVARRPRALPLVLLAYLAAIATPLVIHIFWPAWRTLTPLAFFWAGAAAGAIALGRARLPTAATALALLGCAGVSAHVFDDEARTDANDRELAVTIAARLQAEPAWDGLRTAAFVGAPPALATRNFDTNISALGVPWAAATLLREVWARPLAEPSPADRALAEARCRERPRWPARAAALIDGDLAIVCF